MHDSETFSHVLKWSGIEGEFLGRLSTILPKESPVALLRAYRQLPTHLVSKYDDVYRRLVLEMFNNSRLNWKDPAELAAIIASAAGAGASGQTDLLHSLFVLPDHADVFRKVFKCFADPGIPERRTLVPNLLQEFVFKLSNGQLEGMRTSLNGIITDCKAWYRSLPRDYSVYFSLQVLSLIVPPSKVYRNLKMWPTDEIVNIGKERMGRARDEQLLKVAPQVGQLESIPVKKMFVELVQPKLQSILERTYSARLNHPTGEEAIPEYLAWICEKGKSLNIPNK